MRQCQCVPACVALVLLFALLVLPCGVSALVRGQVLFGPRGGGNSVGGAAAAVPSSPPSLRQQQVRDAGVAPRVQPTPFLESVRFRVIDGDFIEIASGNPGHITKLRLDMSVDGILLYESLAQRSQTFFVDTANGDGSEIFYFEHYKLRLPVRFVSGSVESAHSVLSHTAAHAGVLGLGRASPLWRHWGAFTLSADTLVLGGHSDNMPALRGAALPIHSAAPCLVSTLEKPSNSDSGALVRRIVLAQVNFSLSDFETLLPDPYFLAPASLVLLCGCNIDDDASLRENASSSELEVAFNRCVIGGDRARPAPIVLHLDEALHMVVTPGGFPYRALQRLPTTSEPLQFRIGSAVLRQFTFHVNWHRCLGAGSGGGNVSVASNSTDASTSYSDDSLADMAEMRALGARWSDETAEIALGLSQWDADANTSGDRMSAFNSYGIRVGLLLLAESLDLGVRVHYRASGEVSEAWGDSLDLGLDFNLVCATLLMLGTFSWLLLSVDETARHSLVARRNANANATPDADAARASHRDALVSTALLQFYVHTVALVAAATNIFALATRRVVAHYTHMDMRVPLAVCAVFVGVGALVGIPSALASVAKHTGGGSRGDVNGNSNSNSLSARRKRGRVVFRAPPFSAQRSAFVVAAMAAFWLAVVSRHNDGGGAGALLLYASGAVASCGLLVALFVMSTEVLARARARARPFWTVLDVILTLAFGAAVWWSAYVTVGLDASKHRLDAIFAASLLWCTTVLAPASALYVVASMRAMRQTIDNSLAESAKSTGATGRVK